MYNKKKSNELLFFFFYNFFAQNLSKKFIIILFTWLWHNNKSLDSRKRISVYKKKERERGKFNYKFINRYQTFQLMLSKPENANIFI